MSDEFDGLLRVIDSSPVPARNGTSRVARLVCRLYRAATPALRSRMLVCLLRPLGTLATVGVAAGAFGSFLYCGGAEGTRAALGDVARFTNEQVIELARFVEQVSPDALYELARLTADQSAGLATFSVSVALLLLQVVRRHDAVATIDVGVRKKHRDS